MDPLLAFLSGEFSWTGVPTCESDGYKEDPLPVRAATVLCIPIRSPVSPSTISLSSGVRKRAGPSVEKFPAMSGEAIHGGLSVPAATCGEPEPFKYTMEVRNFLVLSFQAVGSIA